MKKALLLPALLAFMALPPLSSAPTGETATPPLGYMTLRAPAGTGSTALTTPLSIPLHETMEGEGAMSGTITHASPTALTNATAGWRPGQLSNPAEPCLIKMTSGGAEGRLFLIAASPPNTANTVTIHAADIVAPHGIVPGDAYEIIPCDTLLTLLGTPESHGVLGGSSIKTADSVIIVTNGLSDNCYFNTTLNRWTRSGLGNADASNTPIRPDQGFWYSRFAGTDLVLEFTGRVPALQRVVPVKNSGVTSLANGWPIDMTLATSGISSLPSWVNASMPGEADLVQAIIAGATREFWHDGTHWREKAPGSPVADDLTLPAGGTVFLRRVNAAPGATPFIQPRPYNLD